MGKGITVVGGDLRQITVAEELAKDGFDISVYGFDKEYLPHGISPSETIGQAVCGSKIIILGISPCDSEMNIDTPFFKESLSAHSLICQLPQGVTIIGGKFSKSFTDLCLQKNIRYIDYVNREDFAVLNAVPTAEGAIAIAMDSLQVTLHSCKCLISGFGRIGKILARDLHCLGADVTCTARKASDLAWIDALGYKSLPTSKIASVAHNFDLIFNTVPHLIFSREVLRNIRPDTPVIDLASKPGGVDFDAAKQLDIKVIWALALPGKCAPITAGKIIKNTIANILNEI